MAVRLAMLTAYWDTEFDHIIHVAKNKTDLSSDMYTVYYTTEQTTASELRADMLLFKENVPTGWSATIPSNKASIIAFVVALNDNAPNLDVGDSLVISYKTNVKEYPDTTTTGETVFSDVSYTNTNNMFYATYDGFPGTSPSNQVSA